MEFDDHIAVVTGAADGIGAAIARALAARGARVAALDIRPIANSERIRGWTCDVTQSSAVRDACADIVRTLGPVSMLVNNAGGSGAVPVEQVEDLTDAVWDGVLSVNLSSIMRCCRELVPGMKERGYGRIVNVSSTLKDGLYAPLGTLGARLPYVAAKSAIVGLTKQLAKDLGGFGITVNAVAPGLTLPGENARITQRFRALGPDEQRRFAAHIPAGRPGSGDDVANAVLFLLSPASSYVSGEVLTVAGAA